MNEQIEIMQRRAVEIADLRDELARAKEEYADLMVEFELETSELRQRILDADLAIDHARTELEHAALEEYNRTGSKKLVNGIGIRENSKIEYDEKEALKWAIEHKLALKLDATKFKTYAPDLEFVTVSKVPAVTLPTDNNKLRNA